MQPKKTALTCRGPLLDETLPLTRGGGAVTELADCKRRRQLARCENLYELCFSLKPSVIVLLHSFLRLTLPFVPRLFGSDFAEVSSAERVWLPAGAALPAAA